MRQEPSSQMAVRSLGAARREYGAALEAIAGLRPEVDAFFDRVMVMAPEPEIRANRLALVGRR